MAAGKPSRTGPSTKPTMPKNFKPPITLLALDPATGRTLGHVNAGGRMVASPMTYQLDGRQYLLTPVQNVIFA